MQIDTRIGFEKVDSQVGKQFEPALDNLWKDEAFRGQIIQLVIKELAAQGFKARDIQWVLEGGEYVLSILVGNVLKGLTQNVLNNKVVPFIKENVKNHRDFKPVS